MTPFPPILAPIIIPPVRGIRDHRPHLKPAAPITDTVAAQRYGLPYRAPSCAFTVPIPPAPLMLTAPKIAGYLPCPAT